MKNSHLAAAACFAVAMWQSATVHINYEGKISGLFCIGQQLRLPRWATEATPVFRQPTPYGYDGAWYWLIAQDPFFQRDTASFIDDPRVRYRRIMVPLLAWAASAGGIGGVVPLAYAGVMLGFIFLGVYSTAVLCRRHGFAVFHGLWFLVLPATLTSIDRMTVDVALAALLASWVTFRTSHRGLLWAILAGAALCRETGFLLIAAEVLFAIKERCWRDLTVPVLAALPAGVWALFVHSRTPPSPAAWIGWIPLEGPLVRIFHPIAYPALPFAWVVQVFDYVALAGALLGFVWLVRYYRPPVTSAAAAAAWVFGLQAAMISQPEVWSVAYAFGRTMTPLWALTGLAALHVRSWVPLLPVILISMRVLLQFGTQVKGLVLFVMRALVQ